MVRNINGPYFLNGQWTPRSYHKIESILGHADIVRFVKSRRISRQGHIKHMDDPCMLKKILNEEIYGRKKTRTTKKMLDNSCGGGPQDEHLRLVSEDPKLTGLEENCAGGQGPYWTVVPD